MNMDPQDAARLQRLRRERLQLRTRAPQHRRPGDAARLRYLDQLLARAKPSK